MKFTAARLFSAVRRRRIAGVAETIRATVVRNDRGAIWDIKLLRECFRAGVPPDLCRDCRSSVSVDKISSDHV